MSVVYSPRAARSALSPSRKFTCLYLLVALFAVSSLMGWAIHPLIAVGFLSGCGYRLWHYYRGTPRPRNDF